MRGAPLGQGLSPRANPLRGPPRSLRPTRLFVAFTFCLCEYRAVLGVFDNLTTIRLLQPWPPFREYPAAACGHDDPCSNDYVNCSRVYSKTYKVPRRRKYPTTARETKKGKLEVEIMRMLTFV